MCSALGLQRSSYYYQAVPPKADTELENAVITEFHLSRGIYGARKLKKELSRSQNGHGPIRASRRRIGKVMSKYGMVSKYTLRRTGSGSKNTNNDPIPNKVNREFANREPLEVVVSDLTYVKCAVRWHYICVLLDLGSRKIIGSAIGRSKDAKLVRTAFCGTIIHCKNYISINPSIDPSYSSTEHEFTNTSFMTDCISINNAGEIKVIDDPTVASDSLRFSFQNECYMLDDIFPNPAIQFDIHIDIPWVLDIPYSGYIDITRNKV